MSDPWPQVPLRTVLSPVSRPENVQPEVSYRLLGAHWYAEGLYVKDTKSGADIQAGKVYRVECGDFVYNRLFAWKGSFAVAAPEHDGCYVSNEFPCFRINRDRIDPRFLLRYFSRSRAWEEALGLSSGGTPTSRNRLKEAKLLDMQIPLPSLCEQRRIVARIEELAGKIEEARGLRQRAAEETDALTPARLSELIGDPYGDVPGLLQFKSFARINDVCNDVADGPHVTPTYVDEGVPFITVLNITSGRINFDGAKFITREQHNQFQKRAKAEPGDVLISKDGTIGIPCYVDTERDFSFFVSVALVKPIRGRLDGRFLTWMIRSPYLQQRIVARSRGDMIRHLVLREIRELVIPVPCLDEQHRIVAYLDELQAKVDSLKQMQAEIATELDALLPSVLDRAFKGEL